MSELSIVIGSTPLMILASPPPEETLKKDGDTLLINPEEKKDNNADMLTNPRAKSDENKDNRDLHKNNIEDENTGDVNGESADKDNAEPSGDVAKNCEVEEALIPERILDKRNHKDTIEYLVKWKDFDSPSDYTWETASDLNNDKMVQAYEKMVELAQQYTRNENEDDDVHILSDHESTSSKYSSQKDSKATKESAKRPRRESTKKQEVVTPRRSSRASAVKPPAPVGKRRSSVGKRVPSKGHSSVTRKSKKEPVEAADDVYEMEEVIGKKIKGKKLHYHIRWKGYEETTWEPADALFSDELVKEFEEKQKIKTAQKKKQKVLERKDSSLNESRNFPSHDASLTFYTSEEDDKEKKFPLATKSASGKLVSESISEVGSLVSLVSASETRKRAHDGFSSEIEKVIKIKRADSGEPIACVIMDGSEKLMPYARLKDRNPEKLFAYYEDILNLRNN